ncbi:MAG TPA: hypothetical protein VML75_11165 [Kofleriaceae bacterium]|nr:hypothetical protein [Kofleriaceae bacterium]
MSATPSSLLWDAELVLEVNAPCAIPAIDEWTGTATRGESAFGTDDIATSVSWRRIDTTACVDTYELAGTAHYFYGIPGALCTQTVEPETLLLDPSDGMLQIDRTTSPPTYWGAGETSWAATWVCTFSDDSTEELSIDAGGVWLDASGMVVDGAIQGAFMAERPDCHLNEREHCEYAWSFRAVGP